MQSMNYPFPGTQNESMGGYKITNLGAPTESGDAVRWDDLLAWIGGLFG